MRASKVNAVLFFAASICALLFVAYVDQKVRDLPLFEDGQPRVDALDLFRSLIIALSSLFFVVAVATMRAVQERVGRAITYPTFFQPVGILKAWHRYFFAWLVLVLSSFFLFLFLSDKELFYHISEEDTWVEVASAVFSFIACILLFVSASLNRSIQASNRVVRITVCVGFGILVFTIGMEELSWLHRAFEFELPEIFLLNDQETLSLHNFATDAFENWYYFGAFIFFIVLPLIGETGIFHRLPALGYVIPSRFVFIGPGQDPSH